LTSKEILLRKLEAKKEALERLDGRQLELFAWNSQQKVFLNDDRREVLLSGMNQGGKSTVLCGMLSYHLTGLYPEWWEGVRFDKPPVVAIAGETALTTRDLIANRILGEPNARGTGMIPKDCLVEISPARGGLVDQVESFLVQWHDHQGRPAGHSKCYVFAYSKGWERVQGYRLDLVAIDEEPDFKVYDELSARLNASRGYFRLAMTPLHGQTDLFMHFAEHDNNGQRGIVYYDITQATHWDEEHRKEVLEKYSNHPYAEARLRGLPIAGEGLIYPVPDERITVEDFLVPSEWKGIIGLDFPHTIGSFAAVRLAIDETSDTYYLIDSYKSKGDPVALNAHRVAAMGGKVLPVAWPHDGGRVTGDGSTVAGQYRDMGLNMIHESASMIDIAGKKTRTVWGVIEEIYERMMDGRFKVFASQLEFFREKTLYRHEEGKIVKNIEDHIIDAMHKAVMHARFAGDYSGRAGVETYTKPGGVGDLVGPYNFYKGWNRDKWRL